MTTSAVAGDTQDPQRPALRVVSNSVGVGRPIGQSDPTPADETGTTRETRVRAHAKPSLAAWPAITRSARRVASYARTHLTPPDFIRKPQPSLIQVFNAARWGEQNPPTGPGRVLSISLAVVLIPAVGVFKWLAWVVERPARLLVFVGLTQLAKRTPYLSDVLDVIAAAITAAVDWLLT